MGGVTVSVIIPTRNRAQMLQRAIQSVLTQTCGDLELIVVDDGSTDDTGIVVSAMRDDRIQYVRLAQRGGAGRARNTGLALARGEFVAFLDDDDEWLPAKLEKQLAVFRTAPAAVGVVYSGFLTVSDQSGRTVREVHAAHRNTAFLDFLESSIFMTSVPLVRRRCFDVVGTFDEELVGCQDKDLWLRLAKHFAFDHASEALVKYHVHGAQITTDLKAKILAKEQILIKYLDELTPYPPLLAKHLIRIGFLCCADNAPAEGRRYLLEALQADPRRRDVRYHVLYSLLDPSSHRDFLMRRVFPNVEGVALYY